MKPMILRFLSPSGQLYFLQLLTSMSLSSRIVLPRDTAHGVNRNLNKLMQSRDKLKKTAVKSKSPLLISSYRHIRNKINKQNSELDRQCFSERISEAKGDMKESWKVVSHKKLHAVLNFFHMLYNNRQNILQRHKVVIRCKI